MSRQTFDPPRYLGRDDATGDAWLVSGGGGFSLLHITGTSDEGLIIVSEERLTRVWFMGWD